MTPDSDAIISIHPRHANAILDGAKTIELRRRIPYLSIGTRLWIYATRPIGAVIGMATVERIVRGDPEEIWLEFGDQAGIERIDFDAYFDGAQEAIGLILVDVRRNAEHVEIEQLRCLRDRFHPPQVMMNISNREAQLLHRMAGSKG
ncbi:putative transcriptional regulator [Sphingomonas vulcanisoli]|uniref:Transcriptional regulator n=1 Tax=Sphingomonas vulcanisoli TaxID=1658060 RepID=A0ABX0TYP8_9SPHN|nr:ASCH domain-containing protein [Sphingomonas vulcanisoli]NIJ09530.1 putative transcriptional regulator [Sphingomonas vulcanisoli]